MCCSVRIFVDGLNDLQRLPGLGVELATTEFASVLDTRRDPPGPCPVLANANYPLNRAVAATVRDLSPRR